MFVMCFGWNKHAINEGICELKPLAPPRQYFRCCRTERSPLKATPVEGKLRVIPALLRITIKYLSRDPTPPRYGICNNASSCNNNIKVLTVLYADCVIGFIRQTATHRRGSAWERERVELNYAFVFALPCLRQKEAHQDVLYAQLFHLPKEFGSVFNTIHTPLLIFVC